MDQPSLLSSLLTRRASGPMPTEPYQGEIRNLDDPYYGTGGPSLPAKLAYMLSGIPMAIEGVQRAREGSLAGDPVKAAGGAPAGDAKAMLSLYGDKDHASLAKILKEGAKAGKSVQPVLSAQDAATNARRETLRKSLEVETRPPTRGPGVRSIPGADTSSAPRSRTRSAGSDLSNPATIEATAVPRPSKPAATRPAGQSANSSKPSLSHHSARQPRNKQGRFDGAPLKLDND